MSLYNMVNGFNPACVFLLPMLGRKYDEYPRFRDCFVTDDGNIQIYTRVGGANRNTGYGEEKLYDDPNFVTTFDDEFDNTYGSYIFKVPEKWKNDFDLVLSGKFDETSEEYQKMIKEAYPYLVENGLLDKFFSPVDDKGTENND